MFIVLKPPLAAVFLAIDLLGWAMEGAPPRPSIAT
jgi:hypothetical protein